MGEGCTGGPGSSNPDADRIPTQAPEPDDGNLTAKYLTRTPCGTVTLFSIPSLCLAPKGRLLLFEPDPDPSEPPTPSPPTRFRWPAPHLSDPFASLGSFFNYAE